MTRRVLLCTIGTTPQVVTETVWALRRRDPPWIPDEVVIITTTQGLPRVRGSLQAPNGPLAELMGCAPPTRVCVPCRDGGLLSFAAWDAPGERTPPTPAGDEDGSEACAPLSDVNTPDDTTTMGDAIHRLLVQVVRDPDTQLHLSLAGGRKTMSAHALLSFTLAARDTDEASHVLVGPPFETHRDFWHPDQPTPVWTADGLQVSAREAQVSLVPLTTPLMRYRIKNVRELEDLDLRGMVRQVNVLPQLQNQPNLTLDTTRNTVVVAGVECRLGHKLFAVYRLLATARAESWPGVGPDGEGTDARGWLTFEHICRGETPDGTPIDRRFLEFIVDALRADGNDLADGGDEVGQENPYSAWRSIMRLGPTKAETAKGNINPNLVNVAKALRKAFGPEAASYLAPADKKTKGRFGLPMKLPSQAIQIV